MNLKLATINFWGLPWPFSVKKKERLNLLIALINKERFDIVALQEIWTNYDINTIKKNCPGYFVRDQRNPIFNHSGLVILSRFPLHSIRFIPFKGSLMSLEFPSRKGMLQCDADINEQQVQIINSHMYYDTSPEQAKKQKKQLLQLIELLDHRPTFILGDFNRTSEMMNLPKHFKLISERDNASIDLKNKFSTMRFNKINASNRLPDYIFTNMDVSVYKSYLITDTIFSDHYPVVTEIEIE